MITILYYHQGKSILIKNTRLPQVLDHRLIKNEEFGRLCLHKVPECSLKLPVNFSFLHAVYENIN